MSEPAKDFRPMALIIASAMFMEQLDATVLTTALPTMARDFGVAPLKMSLSLTGYLLSLAIFIPISGRIADRFGALRIFRAAIAVFLLGSILCGLSNSLGVLVAARLVQGLGGAMMIPVGRLVLLRSVPKSELVSAMSWLLVPSLIGPVIGPMVGGFIVTYVSWRWIFFINVPIGILGAALAGRYIAEVKGQRRETDLIGFLLSGTALSCLMFGLELATHYATNYSVIALLFVIGLISGVLYLAHARRHPDPVLDLRLLKIATFRLSTVAGSISRIAAGSIPFLLPLMMQLGFGFSPARSGTITFATAAGSMLMKSVAPKVLRRFGFRRVMVWNGLISSAFIGCYAFFRPDTPLALIYALLLIGGFFQSLQFTAYNTIAYADIPSEEMSSATSFYTTIQQLMLSLGICFAATLLHVTSFVFSHGTLTLPEFSFALFAVAAISAWASAACRQLRPDAGADMSGHRSAQVATKQTQATDKA